MDPLDLEVGQRLEAIRIGRGLKQSDLAALLKSFGLPWSQRTISRVETGDRTLRFTESFKLASALGIEPEDLAPQGVAVSLAFDRARRALSEASADAMRADFRLAKARQSAQAWRLVYELSLGQTGPYVVHGDVVALGYWLNPIGNNGADGEGEMLNHAQDAPYVHYATVLRALGLTDAELARVKDQADSARSKWLERGVLPYTLDEPMRVHYEDKAPNRDTADRVVDDIHLDCIAALFAQRFTFVEFTNSINEKQFRVDGIDFDTIQGPWSNH